MTEESPKSDETLRGAEEESTSSALAGCLSINMADILPGRLDGRQAASVYVAYFGNSGFSETIPPIG